MKPIAIEFFGLTIYWYGILAAIGFWLGIWTAAARAKREGMVPDTFLGLTPWLIGGAILGARVLYVVTFWKTEFASKPFYVALIPSRTGLVYYGGLIGSSLCCIYYCARHKLPLWKAADALAPSVALGHAFGRIGCFMTGCCYGHSTNVPWAVHFPHEHFTAGAAVHPVQLYESTLNFLLFAGLALLHRRKRFDGQIFSLYLISYALLRFSMEFFRGDSDEQFGGWASRAQLVSGGILVTGIVLGLWLARSARQKAASTNVP